MSNWILDSVACHKYDTSPQITAQSGTYHNTKLIYNIVNHINLHGITAKITDRK
ncbi:hypothetical protein BV133_3347 [Blastochloris viridis]|uniref:Uncharacterized protein n=1 Tax=Blastochloris viridis TaxID=1079 RepID=A0A182D633_BLAVI|nr:hypothetical protein BV133_3347 [Blastochloris viridis]